MKYTVVLLTYNRRHRLVQQIQYLSAITTSDVEIIVVDNASDEKVDDLVEQDARIKLVRNNTNLGAVGRNIGMRLARGDYIVTLDDDVYGITDTHLKAISAIFSKNSSLAAINFSVLEEKTDRITDWCHPRDLNTYSNSTFLTNDISEGAVAFRKTALVKVGYYPDSFFISHEGPDLAFRLIDAGFDVIYTPQISVTHAFEQQGRDSWRRYYYDTRNQLWLAVRNYPLLYAVKQLFLSWGSLFVYAVRDGYLRYWAKGIYDGIKGCRQAYAERQAPKASTIEKIREIEMFRPNILARIKKRVFSNVVRG